tara:strand:- start:36684 stop:37784 length:1101 start_codon:yes stop_codon:yes gene_type:complete
MTYATATRQLASLLLVTLPFTTSLQAQVQDVYLSEIRADASETWIEVHNRGTVAADISQWSLHCATTTQGMPNNYWWPFPAGTTLAPDAFLRVHWFTPEPAVPVAGNLYTGTSPYGFLFGLGGETLSGDEGAAALFASQSNTQMNSSLSVRDWVSWGTHGFQRESLAISAGLWQVDRSMQAIQAGASIARDPDAIGVTVHPDESWFLDYTPTPLMPNVTGAVVQSYGTACALPGNHLLGVPELRATSLPLLGNSQFGLMIDRTTGIYGEFVLVGFSSSSAPPGLPSILPQYSGTACQESIDTTQLIATWLVPAMIIGTPVSLPLDGLPPQVIGVELHAQALVIELLPTANPPYQGLTNALRVVVGQ